MRQPPRTPRRHGFTLIELLVVVGIIGVLIAILVPVLGRVRDSAATTKCASNLRQIGAAVLMYANDNNDAVIPVGYRNLAAATGGKILTENYATILTRAPGRAYLQAPNAAVPTSTANNPTLLNPNDALDGSSVFECPSANNAAQEFWTVPSISKAFATTNGSTTTAWAIRTYYGINGTLGGGGREVDMFPARTIPVLVAGNALTELRALTTVPTPSKMVLLFDGKSFPASAAGAQPTPALFINGPHSRRDRGNPMTGKTNLLFFDGHVATFARTELPTEADLQDVTTPVDAHPLATNSQYNGDVRWRMDIQK
jgi:prepilin-type N-terminal cleavage/methylation domain-containing protein/prepilin-type processing-associated H-X9-DG protein